MKSLTKDQIIVQVEERLNDQHFGDIWLGGIGFGFLAFGLMGPVGVLAAGFITGGLTFDKWKKYQRDCVNFQRENYKPLLNPTQRMFWEVAEELEAKQQPVEPPTPPIAPIPSQDAPEQAIAVAMDESAYTNLNESELAYTEETEEEMPRTTSAIAPVPPGNPNGDWDVLNDLLGYPSILIYGPPGSGKSTLAEWLMYKRIEKGHDVEILDPHRKFGQWEGLKVYGEGLDYDECDSRLEGFLTKVKARYKRRAETAQFNPKPCTILCEEFTQWSRKCRNAGHFFEATVSDIRKINMHVVYVSHGRSLATLGGAAGFGRTRDSALLEVELIAMVDPVSGEAVPSGKGRIYYPGQKRNPITFTVPDLTREKAIAPSPLPSTPTAPQKNSPLPFAPTESTTATTAESKLLEWMAGTGQQHADQDGFVKLSVIRKSFRYRDNGESKGLSNDELLAIAQSLLKQDKVTSEQSRGIKLC